LGVTAQSVGDELGSEVCPGFGTGLEDDLAGRLGVLRSGRPDLPGVAGPGQLLLISLATRSPEATALFM
jgi:hypothetical protein